MFVAERFEVCATAGFVEAGRAYNYEFLTLAGGLGVDGGRDADHTNGGGFGDLVCEGHEVGDWAEGLVGEGGVETGEDHALAEVDEFHGEVGEVVVEELDFIEADDV